MFFILSSIKRDGRGVEVRVDLGEGQSCRGVGLVGDRFEGDTFEGLSRGVRGDALTFWGHLYMFINIFPYRQIITWTVTICVPLSNCSSKRVAESKFTYLQPLQLWTSKGGSIGSTPGCGPRDPSSIPAWGKLV